MRTLELTSPENFDLVRSQKMVQNGLSDPCMRIEDGVVSRATRTPEGPASLSATQEGHRVRMEVHGDGAAWIEKHARDLLGLADEPEAFSPADETLRKQHERTPTYLPRTLVLFERLVPTILQQLVTWREAMLAWHGIVREFGEQAPGPFELYLAPTRQKMAHTPYYALSAHGVLKRRSDTIRRAAKSVGRLDPLTHEPDDLARKLETAPGIGPWTSQSVLATVLGYPDAVPLGDVHLPHHVSFALAGEPRGTDERMLELLEPYRGHRYRVINLIHASGKTPPRRGPKRGMQTRSRILGR